jgi:hypothetical protein
MTSLEPKPEESFTSSLKLSIVIFGALANLGLALHQYLFFLRAYADPAKGAVLLINVYGEANMELFLLSACAVLGTIGTLLLLNAIHKARKTGRFQL